MSLKELEKLKSERDKHLNEYVERRNSVGKINGIFFKKYNVIKKYDAVIRNHGDNRLIIQLEHAKIMLTMENNNIDYDFNELKSNYRGFEELEASIEKKKYMLYIAEKVSVSVFVYLKKKHKEFREEENKIYKEQESEINRMDIEISKKEEELIYKMLTRQVDIENELNQLLESKSGIRKAYCTVVGSKVLFSESLFNVEIRSNRKVYLVDKKVQTKSSVISRLAKTIFNGKSEIKELKDLDFYEKLIQESRSKYLKIRVEDLLLHLKDKIKVTLKVEEF